MISDGSTQDMVKVTCDVPGCTATQEVRCGSLADVMFAGGDVVVADRLFQLGWRGVWVAGDCQQRCPTHKRKRGASDETQEKQS